MNPRLITIVTVAGVSVLGVGVGVGAHSATAGGLLSHAPSRTAIATPTSGDATEPDAAPSSTGPDGAESGDSIGESPTSEGSGADGSAGDPATGDPAAETPSSVPAGDAETYATAAVTRGDLSSRHKFNAAISFGEKWTVNTAATGVVTKTVTAGTVVGLGQPLVWINNVPVLLIAGETPVYRDLELVNTSQRGVDGKRLTLLEGDDVIQLQRFLIQSGFDEKGKLVADGEFGKTTRNAVKAWQKSLGVPATGKVDSTQIVFAAQPLRIATNVRSGAPFESLEVTVAKPTITVDTSNNDRVILRDASKVEIELPDGATLAGSLGDQRNVTKDDGTQVWRTVVNPSGELPADGDAATVWATETAATDSLIVPTAALLAVADGGFALEVIDGTANRLVGVEIGEVLEAQVSITGDVSEGDQVVIAS